MATDVAGTGLPWVEAIARSFAPYSFARFHRLDLPALVARNGHLVADDLRDADPLAFRCEEGTTFTWVPSDDGVRVVDGDAAAATVVELSEDAFSEFLHELLTASGAVRTGRASVTRGGLGGWQRWEPAIQSLSSGRDIYTAAVWQTLVDRDGTPLDLRHRFDVDDDTDEMTHFLDAAGYVHIKGVFSPAEVEYWGAEVEKVRHHTTPGDPFSWWSMNASGDEVVTRINYVGRHSSVLQELSHDPRLARFARLAGADLQVCDDRLDGPMVFVKNAN